MERTFFFIRLLISVMVFISFLIYTFIILPIIYIFVFITLLLPFAMLTVIVIFPIAAMTNKREYLKKITNPFNHLFRTTRIFSTKVVPFLYGTQVDWLFEGGNPLELIASIIFSFMLDLEYVEKWNKEFYSDADSQTR